MKCTDCKGTGFHYSIFFRNKATKCEPCQGSGEVGTTASISETYPKAANGAKKYNQSHLEARRWVGGEIPHMSFHLWLPWTKYWLTITDGLDEDGLEMPLTWGQVIVPIKFQRPDSAPKAVVISIGNVSYL